MAVLTRGLDGEGPQRLRASCPPTVNLLYISYTRFRPAQSGGAETIGWLFLCNSAETIG